MYQSGSRDGPPMTVPVDPQLCFRWNLAAAKQEHVRAMFRTGRAYSKGRGVKRNDKSAFEWYKRAAKKGDQIAQFKVGNYYERGKGVDVDLAHAMHWYQKSAAQEYQQAIDAIERLDTDFGIYDY